MKKLLLSTLFLLGSCRNAQRVETPVAVVDPSHFNEQQAFTEVQMVVTLGSRDAGTPGAEKAALYLFQRLGDLGVKAEIDVFTNDAPHGPTVFRNVIGTIPGKGRGLVLLASHYDTKPGIDPGFEGANDSASSSGVLLEMARVLASSPALEPTVQILFFDGEEALIHYGPNDGFHGSRHHAQKLVQSGEAGRVLGMILLDMIGDKDLTVTLPHNSTPRLLNAVLEASHAENAREHFALYPFNVGDDHSAFLDAGMPAVDIIDFLYGSAPGRNDYWHTPADIMDKISAESLGIVGRVTLRVVNDLAKDAAKPSP